MFVLLGNPVFSRIFFGGQQKNWLDEFRSFPRLRPPTKGKFGDDVFLTGKKRTQEPTFRSFLEVITYNPYF